MSNVMRHTVEALMTTRSIGNIIEIQRAIEPATWLPKDSDIEAWALEVFNVLGRDMMAYEVCVRIVSEQEIQTLNKSFRNMDSATNVLAFPQQVDLEDGTSLLGDIVICAPIVAVEAKAQAKEVTAHFAHLVVHGMLHLLGYDHIVDGEAEEMESMEIQILKGLGIEDPYGDGRSPGPKVER